MEFTDISYCLSAYKDRLKMIEFKSIFTPQYFIQIRLLISLGEKVMYTLNAFISYIIDLILLC